MDAQVTASNGGALTLITDNSGASNGGTLLFNGGSVQFTDVSGQLGTLKIGVGTGAPVNYTLVSDLQTLANYIAANNSGVFALATPINASGITYSTVPLASTTTTPFAGILEGLGNTISNLTINDSTDVDVGLFSQTANASVIRDLGLVNGAVSISSKSTYAGELVGTGYGAIINASSSGSVTSSSPSNGYIGGLVGINDGSVAQSSSSALVTDGAYAGGLVGINEGALSNVFATGLVKGAGFAGGLTAGNGGTIADAYATGAVVATSFAGGLTAFNDTNAQISNTYASGAVTGSYAAGLIEYNQGSITNVYATGAASGGFAAGLVVFTSNSITNAYASGAVSSASNSAGFAYENTGVISNGYYDQGTTGQTVGIGGSGANQAGVTAMGGRRASAPTLPPPTQTSALVNSAQGPPG